MRRLWTAAVLAVYLWLGWEFLPGHAYLAQDTQIWIPVMEWVYDRQVLARDFLTEAAHLRLTFFDDLAINLRRLIGLGFEPVLQALQLLFRFAGLAGVYLLGRGAKLEPPLALMMAALFGMGTFIMGPSVISIELEPVPRGFAIPLTLLALGLLAVKHERWSGVAVAAGFGFHAPAVWPLLLVRPWRKAWIVPVALTAVLLALAAAFAQSSQMNPFFGRLSPEHEQLQQMRAAYNWISLWYQRYLAQHVLVGLIGLAAFWRAREAWPRAVKPYLLFLPLIGLATVPLSWLLLEKLKWNLMPQVQPMRALLFTTVIALLCCSVAGLRAAAKNHWWEAPFWLFLPCLLPLSPDWRTGPYAMPVYLALGVTFLAWVASRFRALAPVAALAAGLALASPGIVKPRNVELVTPEFQQLIDWARRETPRDAVFLFRDFRRGGPNLPGVFRARALRAIWVDWKGGGQVNYYEGWAREWWRRWQMVEAPVRAGEIDQWRREGIDYLVVRGEVDGAIYRSGRYTVVKVR